MSRARLPAARPSLHSCPAHHKTARSLNSRPFPIHLFGLTRLYTQLQVVTDICDSAQRTQERRPLCPSPTGCLRIQFRLSTAKQEQPIYIATTTMASEITEHDQNASPSVHDDGNGALGVGDSNRGTKRPRPAADDDDDDDDKPGRERRKIEIKFIQDKSRRHITFSKRKAGIMKKVRLAVSARIALQPLGVALRRAPRTTPHAPRLC